MRAGGLGGGPSKIEESKRKHFSVSVVDSPTKPLTPAVGRLNCNDVWLIFCACRRKIPSRFPKAAKHKGR
jgi:hypothetical protein